MMLPVSVAGRWSPVASKVPEITLSFWTIKILSTAMGEATSDYLVSHINPYVAVMLGILCFLGALALQFFVRRYIVSVYWLLVVMVSIFGTMAADVTHVVLGVPYLLSATIFAVSLFAVFMTWFRVEGTLSIHSIFTARREVFYWAAVLATFALGTAVGDMTATTFHLGYFASGLLFLLLFFMPGLGFWAMGLNDILAFWSSYVLTRPLGASFADWIDKPASSGGLGYGSGMLSLVLTTLIVMGVIYLSIVRKETRETEVVLEGDY